MNHRTIEPLRLSLPDDKIEAKTLILEAAFGTISPRVDRSKISSESEGAFQTYVLIEAARKKDIKLFFEGFDVEYSCLFQGQAKDDFALQAPYLAKVEPNSEFSSWLLDEAWGKGFIVFLRSNREMTELRSQFRKITQIYDPENGSWYHFRFYSPEVVRRTLPALPPKEFSEISQGIAAFVTESADAKAIYIV